MEDKKYILAFDVSTSSIGICLFEDLGTYGKLLLLTHFEPKVKENTQIERLKAKADLCVDKMVEDFSKYNIERIVVEKPLLNSNNQKTAQILAMFNEYLTTKISEAFDVPIDFITVHDARKYALPELLGENGKMMSDFPKTVAGLKKNNWSKFLIMYLISQRYPNIQWLLNNNLKINKKNFDRADSIVAILGFMIKEKHWEQMGDPSFWEGADFSYERCVEIIEKNVAYEKFAKEHIDNRKDLVKEQKMQVKRKYLDEQFRIKEYLNVDY
jgi:RNase H-fold protein (predicted Holliday junction resolvase)